MDYFSVFPHVETDIVEFLRRGVVGWKLLDLPGFGDFGRGGVSQI